MAAIPGPALWPSFSWEPSGSPQQRCAAGKSPRKGGGEAAAWLAPGMRHSAGKAIPQRAGRDKHCRYRSWPERGAPPNRQAGDRLRTAATAAQDVEAGGKPSYKAGILPGEKLGRMPVFLSFLALFGCCPCSTPFGAQPSVAYGYEQKIQADNHLSVIRLTVCPETDAADSAAP